MIREWNPSDNLEALTELLHRAYEPLAARGLNVLAAHQTPEITARRIAQGRCFVLEDAGVLAGTICVYDPDPFSSVPEYRKHATYHIGQFAVDPKLGGFGYGRTLHEHALEYASRRGGRWMALDTASPAKDLIEMYARWGYHEVARYKWKGSQYESVILRRSLPPAPVWSHLSCRFRYEVIVLRRLLHRLGARILHSVNRHSTSASS